ncbi:MAG TPA: ABC transporter ATP-binding protein [Phycisphaerae bacterium]|nr:ABC transporter ATP-binding protein [Phycisphaerae bacterium]
MMTTDSKPVVQAVGLTKVFKDFWHRDRVVAVDHLDFEIHAHEVFGLLGPNGSGKTTTIKIMLGLLYPTRGRIGVFGRPATDVAVKSRIGYLPEESYLYRFLNARETLDYYGRLFQLSRPDRRRRVDQLLEMVGLTREARRRVGEYSKGMARRIGLAQALINDPDLLILDEPTTGLDPIGTREIKDLITFLNREKHKTILLCSHLLADVEDVCQRVAVLYGGRRQTMGNIHELLSQENLTQITTERLSDQAIVKIRRIVEQDENKQVVSISAPTARLETFFLQVVREAQATRPEISGAVAGGKIAGFLTETGPGEGRALVDSLIAAASRPAPESTQKPTPPLPSETLAREVIESLISAKPTSPGETLAPQSPGEQVTDQPDETVIEGLLRKPNPRPDQDRED